MRLRYLSLFAAVVVAAPVHAETEADRWNLGEIYPSVAAWNADAGKLEAQFKEFAGCKGHLGDSAARFRQCLDLQADMTKRYYRMAAFSSEQVSEDTGNPAYLELDQKADILGNKLGEASVVRRSRDPEDRQGPRGAFLREDPQLVDLPLSPRADAAPRAAHAQRRGRGADREVRPDGQRRRSGYTILTNADIPYPKVKLSTGEEVTLDASMFDRYRQSTEPRRSQDRDGRLYIDVQDLRAHARRRRSIRS